MKKLGLVLLMGVLTGFAMGCTTADGDVCSRVGQSICEGGVLYECTSYGVCEDGDYCWRASQCDYGYSCQEFDGKAECRPHK